MGQGSLVSKIAKNAGSPYVNASSKADFKGYNCQYNRRGTRNTPFKGSALARRLQPDRHPRRGAM